MTNTIMTYNSFQNIYKRHLYSIGFVLCISLLWSSQAFAIDEEFLKYCSQTVFDEKYGKIDASTGELVGGAGCWSCDIIKILMRSLSSVANLLYNTIMDLCHVILSLGAAIWTAVYFLKSVSSFATQDPAKVIDGALTFFFKWAFIYTLLTFGMDALIENIVNPLLSIGWDIGTEFSKGAQIG